MLVNNDMLTASEAKKNLGQNTIFTIKYLINFLENGFNLVLIKTKLNQLKPVLIEIIAWKPLYVITVKFISHLL